ncbi:MAG: hypothetical protein J7K88_03530 [Candidatus Fermentibacteraceae bacterium]|nr:hypothetical protein [Candidatus Fermentibacteraceae bacterium]
MRNMHSSSKLISAFVLFSALLFLNAMLYMPFLSDDALISARYATRLADGRGLTWTGGSPVEGYSNLLWVLLTAGGVLAGIDAVHTVRLLGIALMVCFALTVLFVYRKRASAVHMIVLLFAVLSAPLGAWAVGGLEQPLIAALLALSVPLVWRIVDNRNTDTPVSMYFSSSVPLALLCIVRCDGAVFTAVAVLFLLFTGNGKRSLLLAVLPVLVFFAQLGFRLEYYGDYLPNTARIKLHLSLYGVLSGAKYVVRGVFAVFPLSLCSVAATVNAVRRKHTRTLLPAAMALIWAVYLVLTGGDVFPAYRQFVPLVVLFTWICAEEFPEIKRTRRISAILAVVFVLFAAVQLFDSRNRNARRELWEWDGRVTALVLKEAFGEREPLLAVTAAGTLPYWSELPVLDMLGLNDRYLAVNQGNRNWEGMPGHQVCNPEYILARQPDIVCFNAAGVPAGLAIAESLVVSEEFLNSYSRVTVQGNRPYRHTGVLWFRKNSTTLGIAATADSLIIPAYFFNSYKHTVMVVQSGSPGIVVSSDHPAGIVLTGLPRSDQWIPAAGSAEPGIDIRQTGDSLLVNLTTEEDSVFVQVVTLIRESFHASVN